jgi:hypothetical protein
LIASQIAVAESANIKKLRTHVRTRDERQLTSLLKNCTDQELLELSLAEKIDTVKLLAKDPHSESEKQRGRIIRITPPRDRPRLIASVQSAMPKEKTAPHPMAWEPESEILEMTWEAPPAEEEVTDRNSKAEPPKTQVRLAGIDALVAAVQAGPSRPQPAVVRLPSPGDTSSRKAERLRAIETTIERLAGRPLAIVGTDEAFDEDTSTMLGKKYARRIVATIVIGATPPDPPLPNQIAAKDPVEAGARLARIGVIDRDGMRAIVSEARNSGAGLDEVTDSLSRR